MTEQLNVCILFTSFYAYKLTNIYFIHEYDSLLAADMATNTHLLGDNSCKQDWLDHDHFLHWYVCVLVTQSCSFDPIDYSLPGSSVHGILQVRISKWVAISSSRGSSQPRNQTRVSCIAVDSLSEPLGKHCSENVDQNLPLDVSAFPALSFHLMSVDSFQSVASFLFIVKH